MHLKPCQDLGVEETRSSVLKENHQHIRIVFVNCDAGFEL